MSEVTKADIAEVHKRIDLVNATLTEVKVGMMEIKTTLKMMPRPPDRPCSFHKDLKADFNGHIGDHKETAGLWQKPLVRNVLDLIKMAIVGGLAWFFGSRH